MNGPTTDAVDYGRRRDAAADRVEHARAAWHHARSTRDLALRNLLDAVRAELAAELEHRAAVVAYEAVK